MSPTEEDDDDAVVGRPNPVPTDSSFSSAKDDRFLISNIFLSFFPTTPAPPPSSSSMPVPPDYRGIIVR